MTKPVPALYAIIWGFCREGRLVPVDEDGNTLENSVVLDQDRLSTTRLKLLPREPIGKLLESGGFKKTTETVTDGLINLQEANQQLRSSLTGLQEDVQLVLDTDVYSGCCLRNPREAFIEELTDRISTTTERLSVVRSQGDGLGDAIEQTNEVQDWFDEVSDVWNRRLASLYRFDVQLTAGNGRFEWADDDAQSEITAQRDALVDFDGAGGRQTAGKRSSQTRHRDWVQSSSAPGRRISTSRGISEFVDRIADHPWVIPAPELPTGVQVAMEHEYITPLRELRRWHETVDGAIASLSSDDEDALLSAADDFADVEPLSETVEYDVDELEGRLDRLTEIVGDRGPDEIDQIGVLPDDRQNIDRRLERLVESRELDIDVTDSG